MPKKKSKDISEKAVEAARKIFELACDRVIIAEKPSDELLKHFERALKVYNSTLDSFTGAMGADEDPQKEFEKTRTKKKKE